jgi:peptide/nickel transport system substrate-binding protein
MTAEDVVFSVERMKAVNRGPAVYVEPVVKVTATDKYTAVFECSRPYPAFLHFAELICPVNKDLVMEHLADGDFGEYGDYGVEWMITHDAGSGPYMIEEHRPNDYLLVTRFHDYFLGWDMSWAPAGTVPIEKFQQICTVESATIKSLMKNRQLALTNFYQSKQTWDELDAIEGIELTQVGFTGWFLSITTTLPPTDDVNFRKALAYAINYDEIFSLVPGGTYAAPIPLHYPEFDKTLELPNYDLAKAKEYLAKSKYAGKDVTITFHYLQGVDNEERISMLVYKNLQDLGINVEMAAPTWPVLADEGRNANINLLFWGHPANYSGPEYWTVQWYHPDNVNGNYFTAHWFKDDTLGELIDEAQVTVDEKKRLELYHKIQQRVMQYQLNLYLTGAPETRAKQDYLVGPRENLPLKGFLENMYNWGMNLERKTELEGM